MIPDWVIITPLLYSLSLAIVILGFSFRTIIYRREVKLKRSYTTFVISEASF